LNRIIRSVPAILLGLGLVFVLAPFLWMLLNAFKATPELYKSPPTFFPQEISLSGFTRLFSGAPMLRWMGNSLFVAVLHTALLLFTSSTLGYIFAKFNFWGKEFCFFLLLVSMMIPAQTTLIPSYLLMRDLGWLDKYVALIVPGTVSAFGIFMCRQYAANVPGALIDAGRMDGAGEFRIFRSIVLPEMTPIISALAIFTFMFKWNDYLWPLVVMNTQNKMPVSLALTFFSTRYQTELNVVYAGGLVVMLPVLIVYLIFQRQLVESLSMTGIK